jgi:uncharacterized membrane protein
MLKRGIVIASAAAGLVLSGAVLARADTQKTGGDMVHCAGVNACKGQGECSGSGHGCGGKNACKGQGWVEMGKDQCLKQGGKVVDGESK